MKRTLQSKYTIRCCIFSMLLFIPSVAFSGAWTAPKGKTYNRIAFNAYYTDEVFDSSGHTEDMANNGEFTDKNVSYYMEHGITDKLTLVFSTSYKFLESDNDHEKAEDDAFSDVDLGLRCRLAQGHFGVLSMQGIVKIPEAYGDNEEISPGNGQYDGTMKLQFGRSLYPLIPGYCNVEAGYRYRDEEPADEFLYLFEFGLDFTKKIYGRVKYDAIIGMNNADNDTSDGSNPSFAGEYDLAKVDIAFGYKLSKIWALELEGLKEVSGESVSKGITYTVAVSFVL